MPLRNGFKRPAQRLRCVSGIQQRKRDSPAEERADVKIFNLHLYRDLHNAEINSKAVRKGQQQLRGTKIDKQNYQDFR